MKEKQQRGPKRMWSPKEDAVNQTEANMLLDACLCPLDHLVVGLALYSGLRISEIQHLKSTWLNWEKGIIEIPARQWCNCFECRRKHGSVY
jgi:integrase